MWKILQYHFPKERFQQHDPLKVVQSSKDQVNITFTYEHEENISKKLKKIDVTFEEFV